LPYNDCRQNHMLTIKPEVCVAALAAVVKVVELPAFLAFWAGFSSHLYSSRCDLRQARNRHQ